MKTLWSSFFIGDGSSQISTIYVYFTLYLDFLFSIVLTKSFTIRAQYCIHLILGVLKSKKTSVITPVIPCPMGAFITL